MDPQVQQKLMVWGVLVPGVVALVALVLAWWLSARRAALREYEQSDGDGAPAPGGGPRWLLPALLALGFAGANSAQFASIPLWPGDNTYRLPHALGLVAILGIVEGFVRLPTLAAFALRVLVYAWVFWMLSWGYKDNELIFASHWVYGGWWALGALGAALLATAHEESSERTPGWIDALVWLLELGGASPVLFFNGYASGPIALTGILAVLGPMVIAGAIAPRARLARGGVTVLAGAVLIMAIGATVHSEIRSVPAGLMLLAAACVGVLAPRSGRRVPVLVNRGVIAALLLAGAGLLAHHEARALEAPDGDDPYADYE